MTRPCSSYGVLPQLMSAPYAPRKQLPQDPFLTGILPGYLHQGSYPQQGPHPPPTGHGYPNADLVQVAVHLSRLAGKLSSFIDNIA